MIEILSKGGAVLWILGEALFKTLGTPSVPPPPVVVEAPLNTTSGCPYDEWAKQIEAEDDLRADAEAWRQLIEDGIEF